MVPEGGGRRLTPRQVPVQVSRDGRSCISSRSGRGSCFCLQGFGGRGGGLSSADACEDNPFLSSSISDYLFSKHHPPPHSRLDSKPTGTFTSVEQGATGSSAGTAGADADAETVTVSNVDPANRKAPKRKETVKLEQTETQLKKAKEGLAREKSAKRKLYSSLVKLASELKRTRAETESLLESANYADRNWYEGGMWRGPELLPGALDQVPRRTIREAVSLSDLFLDLVIVIAFTRVGVAVQNRGTIDAPILAYFAIFWTTWFKEASYSTRFDTTDLSSQAETLLTCFAVLFGSLSATGDFQSESGTCVMIVAAFVALLHFLLHVRVFLWFRDTDRASELYAVKTYATFNMCMTSLEAIIWLVGIFAFPEDYDKRGCIFFAGILCSLRIPKAFLANDFHGEIMIFQFFNFFCFLVFYFNNGIS